MLEERARAATRGTTRERVPPGGNDKLADAWAAHSPANLLAGIFRTAYQNQLLRFGDVDRVLAARLHLPLSMIIRLTGVPPATLAKLLDQLLEVNASEYELVGVCRPEEPRWHELIEKYQLERVFVVFRRTLPGAAVKAVYRSRLHPAFQILVVEPAGPAEEWNAAPMPRAFHSFCLSTCADVTIAMCY